jgi:hypothetical protein
VTNNMTTKIDLSLQIDFRKRFQNYLHRHEIKLDLLSEFAK